ncbi:hypothetical protein LTS18_002665, partial [Coniosporium uncinatum]
LNTTMITGALVMLSVDQKLFHRKNAARNRRMAFYCSLLIGAFIGASSSKLVSPTFALLITAIIKILVGTGFLFNVGVKPKKNPRGEVTPARSSINVIKIMWGD